MPFFYKKKVVKEREFFLAFNSLRMTLKEKRFLTGLTFIEVILVLVIIAVVAGMAAPRFAQNFVELQVGRTANDIAYLMRYAQSRAITKNRTVRLEFEPGLSRYWLTQSMEENFSKEESKDFERISGRMGRVEKVPDKVRVEARSLPIQFYPDGSTDRMRVYVCHKENCLTISTQEQRGAVHVFDYKL